MKDIECNIVKDLMLNYIDKVSSEETNKLVEAHIQNCKECNETLKEMTKDIEFEPLIKQDEEIDYLKGYRKKQKIFKIIASIIIILLILVNFVMGLSLFMTKARVNLELNELTIEGWEYDGKIGFYFYNDKNIIVYDIIEDKENKAVYIKLKGKYDFKPLSQSWQSDITTDIEQVYIKNEKGDTKLVWDKSQGILVVDITDNVKASYQMQQESLLRETKQK